MTPSLRTATAKAKAMFLRGVTIFAVTKQGVETATKIRNSLNQNKMKCRLFATKCYGRQNVTVMRKKLTEETKDCFGKVDALVMVMATGIAVRTVAPLLENKMVDPAVVCVDASGRFVISLLSGHYGGANQLTRLIAEELNAVPVITTASDVLGKQSVDDLARELRCKIMNSESLVAVNSVLVNGDELALVLVGKAKVAIDLEGYEVRFAEGMKEAVDVVNCFDAGVIIVADEVKPEGLLSPATLLNPKKITVGVGSRKDVNPEDIIGAVKGALDRLTIPLWRVDCLATVEIKRDAESMLKAAEMLGLRLEFISIEELGSFRHRDLGPDSDVVKEKIGVGGVCEQAALITTGKNAKLILKKTKAKGVTVAVAEGE